MVRVSSRKGIRLREIKRIQKLYYRLKLDGTIKRAFEGKKKIHKGSRVQEAQD